jgi:DNA-binding MarR family transcriptional regulator
MGLVLRVSNPQDRREVEVRLTESGLASIEKLERERIRRFDQVIQSMTAEDRNALLTGLGAFVVAAVGDDHQLVEDICLRCGSMASSDCPIARCQTVEFCT